MKLPVAAVSLDFLGVPGSAFGNETAALVEKYGFPSDKRLGAGVVDGRSVFADGETPTNLVAALLKKVRACSMRGSFYTCLVVSSGLLFDWGCMQAMAISLLIPLSAILGPRR